MRFLPASTGFLLAFSLLAAAPQTAAAADNLCDTLSGAQPISTYVQKVLERADQGMSYAEQGESGITESFYGLEENAGTAVLEGMDTQRRVTIALQNLTERSACLRYDSILISCKIEEVRKKLNEELEGGDPSSATVMKLQELLLFLFDRDRHLIAGANDPWYADPDWGRMYAFDQPNPGYCCRTNEEGLACEATEYAECEPGTFWKTESDCEQECGVTSFPVEDPRICPYDSDLAMPTEGGYGCDDTVMPDTETFADEKEAMKALKEAVERLRQRAMDTSSDASSSAQSFSSRATRPPKITGCASDFGYCQGETALTCSGNNDCETGACIFQKGTCLNDPNKQCTEDAECTKEEDNEDDLASVCILPPTSPPATVIRRGPFNLGPDQLRLLTSYVRWNSRIGASRPFPSTFSETREEDPDASEDEYVDPLDYLMSQSDRAKIRNFGARLAADQARLIPLVETSDRLANMLMPLRRATASFSIVASAKEGIRLLVREFASFLHRTCLTDPCQTDLERVWTIANTDECFPYADGSYLEDDCTEAGQSRAQKCADKAGISIEVSACSSSSSGGF